jgi:hypothetical protein
MQMAPGIPRPFARANSSAPYQGNITIIVRYHAAVTPQAHAKSISHSRMELWFRDEIYPARFLFGKR